MSVERLPDGAPKVHYGEPTEAWANISAASGSAQAEQFGNALMYDKVIVTDDINIPIDENTVLCIDSPPKYTDDGNLIYDYVVSRVARSINSVSIAVTRADVS